MKTSDVAILAAVAVAVVAMLKYAGVIGSKVKYDQAYLEKYGLGAYLAATGEDPPAGVTIGSLMNTGIGGGTLTTKVTDVELFHTGATGGLF